ncbi:hypothetical protein BJ508DRAFT_334755 [Ascobolus immersus RN42]|uniref:Uncharacterized protein n=1 Tax=Ascobolus immersus RN42 TaxID=1160509 RepID=A0A3N4HJJ7_ASCIM|nr:hypothetical protein BJ508DRAFT_334755 [Ascobolus immersus RN42]
MDKGNSSLQSTHTNRRIAGFLEWPRWKQWSFIDDFFVDGEEESKAIWDFVKQQKRLENYRQRILGAAERKRQWRLEQARVEEERRRFHMEVLKEIPPSDEEDEGLSESPIEIAIGDSDESNVPPPTIATPAEPPPKRKYVEHVIEPLPPATPTNPRPKKAARWILLDDQECSTTDKPSLEEFIAAPAGTKWHTKRLNTRYV